MVTRIPAGVTDMQDLGDDDDNDDVPAHGDGGAGEQSSRGDGIAHPARPPRPARRPRPTRATAYDVQQQAAIHSGSTPAGEALGTPPS